VNCFEDNCDSNAIKVKDTNRGCDAEYGGPYFFNTIAIGETICGTSSAFDEYSQMEYLILIGINLPYTLKVLYQQHSKPTSRPIL